MRAHFNDRNLRRLTMLLLFVGLLYFFRHLFLLFVFFVVFERSIGLLAGYLSTLTKMKFKHAVLTVVGTLAAAFGGLLWFGISSLIKNFGRLRHEAEALVHLITHSEAYHRYGHHIRSFTPERLMERAQHHVGDAIHYAAEAGRSVLYVFIALVFAVLFLMERDELEELREKMKTDSAPRILLRFFGYTSDAIAITLKLQVVVAAVNTLITLPVLLVLGLPGIPALMALLFVSGLIPVVGGPVAGAVLMTVAYVVKGPVGLGVFIGSTFVLHKIESYYLTPKLTAKHVQLPSFVIVCSLVLFEHAFGLVGLFLSFPCLYVAAKIREGWLDPELELQEEDELTRAMHGVLPRFQTFLNRRRERAKQASGALEAGPAAATPVSTEPVDETRTSTPPAA